MMTTKIPDAQPAIDALMAEHFSDSPKRDTATRQAKRGEADNRLIEQARRYVAKAQNVGEGGRNDAAFQLAGHLAAFECETSHRRLSESEIVELLRGWNIGNAPPLSDDELVQAARSGMVNGKPRAPKLVTATAPSRAPDDAAAALKPYMMTDLGNAERFIALHGDSVRWCAAWGCWLIWTGKRWERDETGQAERWAKRTVRSIYKEAAQAAQSTADNAADLAKRLAEHARKSESGARIGEMLRLARSEPGITVTADMLDRDIWLFNCLNGTLNLRTGKLQSHDRRQLITKLARFEYDPDAKCPTFDAFMVRIFRNREALIEYVARLLGFCMTGDIRHHILAIFYGEGANGKSTLIDTVLHILGEYAGHAPESLIVARSGDEHPTEIADLQGRRLVVASESDEGKRLRVGLVKRMTGDAQLKGRYMRCDYFTFDRTHKSILVTNNKPRISEDTSAIWRRVKLIPFTVHIPDAEQDKDLPAKLRAEAPGILAWLVRGCLRWQADRFDLAEPDDVRAATDEYRHDENPLTDFIEARCIVMDTATVSRAELWEAYQGWAKQTGEKYPMGRRALYDRIRKLEGVDGEAWGGPADKRCRVFTGIGLAFQGQINHAI